MKLLLHACCGPCSIMPYGILKDAGHEITIAYMNSNIHPNEEYRKRGETLRKWAHLEGVEVVESAYNPVLWHEKVDAIATVDGYKREDRCRMCYRLRLEEASQYARNQGFEGLSTTLTVSPYQYIDVIHEELDGVCAATGLKPVFEDFRPFYREATQKSRALGMYRQNYCGCHYSDCEARAEREERKRVRKAQKRFGKAVEQKSPPKLTSKKAANERTKDIDPI